MVYGIIIVIALLLILILINIKISLVIQNNNVAVSINGIVKLKPKIKEAEEEVKKKGFKMTFKKALRFTRDSWPKIRYLFSKSSVKLNLNFKYGLSDAAATAFFYGSANSIIYGIEPILKGIFKSFSGCYSIIPDFKNEGMDYTLQVFLKVKVLHILIFMFKMLPVLKNYKKYIKDKGGVVNA